MFHTVCGAAIDWDATGSFLSGTAGWAGIAALIWATIKGRQTFADYSAQKQSEKQIEAAERILTAAYAARAAIAGVRSPLVESAEIDRARRTLTEGQDVTGVPRDQLDRAVKGQVYITRLNNAKDEFNAVWDVLPIGRAYFGEEVHTALEEIAHQRRVIQVSAESLIEEDGTDKKFAQELRDDLSSASGGNKLGKFVDEQVVALEGKLLPVLRGPVKGKKPKRSPGAV